MGKGDQGVVITRKRSLWTAAEDDILKNYVKIHGAHQWKEVEKITGLKRSGKSCWLRWKDHLQPGLNETKLSEEEKELINQLQAMHGNKWSIIASQLPGRTDNEIKNYWHTKGKRKTTIQNENTSSPPSTCLPPLQQHLHGMQWQASPCLPPLTTELPSIQFSTTLVGEGSGSDQNIIAHVGGEMDCMWSDGWSTYDPPLQPADVHQMTSHGGTIDQHGLQEVMMLFSEDQNEFDWGKVYQMLEVSQDVVDTNGGFIDDEGLKVMSHSSVEDQPNHEIQASSTYPPLLQPDVQWNATPPLMDLDQQYCNQSFQFSSSQQLLSPPTTTGLPSIQLISEGRNYGLQNIDEEVHNMTSHGGTIDQNGLQEVMMLFSEDEKEFD